MTRSQRRFWFAGALLLVLAVAFAASRPAGSAIQLEPGEFLGEVVGVYDGDCLTVLDEDKVQHKIRLSEIDAPEMKPNPGQPFCTRSKQALSDLAFGQTVAVRVTGKSYSREVAYVRTQSANVNLKMVEQGMAWREPRYSKDLAYQTAQDTAKASQLGLWADKDPIPPWEWRKQQKESKKK